MAFSVDKLDCLTHTSSMPACRIGGLAAKRKGSMSTQDSANLNAAQPAFGGQLIRTPTNHPCAKFVVAQHIYAANDARILAEGMMSAQRFMPEMSVWLSVTVQPTPPIVLKAVQMCAGFGMRLVVTEPNNRASLGDYEPVDGDLMEALDKANRHGEVWHPLSEQVEML